MNNEIDLHNRVTSIFVKEVLGEAMRKDASFGDCFVIMESCIAGFIEAMKLGYNIPPAVTVEILEAALDKAIARQATFSEKD